MIAHRYVKLPFGQPRISLSGGSLWLRSRLGVGLVRVDPETLAITATTKVEETSRSPLVCVVGQTLMVNTGYSDVTGYDLNSGAVRFRRPGTLTGAHPEGAVVALREAGLPVRVLIDEAGAEQDRRAWSGDEDPLTFVEDDSGDEALLLTSGSRDERKELRGAGGTRVEAPPDAFEARRYGDLVLFSRGGGELTATNLASGRSLPLGRPHAGAVGPGAIAIVRHGALTLVDAALVAHRFALPLEGAKDVTLDSRCIYVASGELLLAVERVAAQPGDQLLAVERVGAPPVRDTSPARVVFAGASSLVAVQHPRYGRLNLTRPPELVLAKGDEVVLDRVVEGPAGVFKVQAWHKPSPTGSAAAFAPAASGDADAVLTFPVSLIAAGEPPAPAPPAPLAPSLRTLMRELALDLPRTLTRVFELWDDDPTARRALERCGLLLDLGPAGIEQGDPCVLPLAGNGAGDVVGLYLYPPAMGPGTALPVVDLWHETGELTWLAEDFDRYWEALLRKHAAASSGDRLRELCPGLGLAPSAAPPRWFEEAHGADVTVSPNNDLRARERRLVRALRETGANREVVTELAATYEALGWTYQRRTLLTQTE